MSEHYSFLDTVCSMASKEWGKEFPSAESAEREMLAHPEKMGAFAVLELIRRFNKFASEMSPRKESDYRVAEKPEDAKKFPRALVGNLLYSCDLVSGVARHIVVAKDNDGYVLIADAHPEGIPKNYYRPLYACDWHYETEREAIFEAAKADIEYHAPRLDFARRALAAAEAGEDLTEFANGSNLD